MPCRRYKADSSDIDIRVSRQDKAELALKLLRRLLILYCADETSPGVDAPPWS
jgi:hypothetical protein